MTSDNLPTWDKTGWWRDDGDCYHHKDKPGWYIYKPNALWEVKHVRTSGGVENVSRYHQLKDAKRRVETDKNG